jgi:hypothetical protein
MEVLRNLDARGVFGIGKARESVLVNTMWGDEDCVAHVESARELNPTSIYLRYAKYQLPMLRASEREIQRSRSMYKDQSLVSVRRAIAQVEADMGRRENFDKYLSAVPDVAPPENDRNF